jgi:hypothetical protein
MSVKTFPHEINKPWRIYKLAELCGVELQTDRITVLWGDFPSSDILEKRNTTFQKLDLFPSSSEGGEDTSDWDRLFLTSLIE